MVDMMAGQAKRKIGRWSPLGDTQITRMNAIRLRLCEKLLMK